MATPIIEVNLRKLGVPIFTAGSREFELSAATANFLYRYDRPKWVVRPRNGEDVSTTVRLANRMSQRVTVKNGGHSYAGFSNSPGGILLDLCDMKAVKIEDEEDTNGDKVMIMSGGALWRDAYHELAIGGPDHDSLIVNGGRCPIVGVSGFLLGGGFGPFSRSVGMGVDQLVEVDMVTADGNTVTVNEGHNSNSKEGQLFWALRGCGGGNYGIVTRLKIRVKKLRDPFVVAGRMTWNVTKDKLAVFQKMMTDFYTADWDNYLTIDTTWECDLMRSNGDRPFSTRFITYYDGKEDDFKNEVNSKMSSPDPEADPDGYRYYEEFKKQLIRRSLAEKSTMFFHETLWAQWSEETRRFLPSDRAYTLYSSWVIKNDKDRIQEITKIILDQIQEFRKQFSGERGTFGVTWIHTGGAISTTGSTVGPYPWRDGNYNIYILVRWHEKWLVKEMGKFFDECKKKLKTYAINEYASYVNFPDRRFQGTDWAKAYYGDNVQKLRKIYTEWNQNNKVLDFEQHILRAPPTAVVRVQPFEISKASVQAAEDISAEDASGGLGDISAEDTSAEDAIKQWIDGWETHRPPSRGYADYLSDGDRLSRC